MNKRMKIIEFYIKGKRKDPTKEQLNYSLNFRIASIVARTVFKRSLSLGRGQIKGAIPALIQLDLRPRNLDFSLVYPNVSLFSLD